MPSKTYTGTGKVFAGTQSLGSFPYRIEVTTSRISAATLDEPNVYIDGISSARGTLDLGRSVHEFFDQLGETLQLQLETGEQCSFFIKHMSASRSTIVEIVISGPIQ